MNGFRCKFLLKDNPQFRKYFWIILLIECVWLALVSSVPASQNSIEQSVFHITNYQQSPDWKSPWKMKPTSQGQGSGFLIHDNWILTNAHVVSDSRMLLVNKISSAEPFLADVLAIAHDSDLALLKVRDPKFYQDLNPLELGGIPSYAAGSEPMDILLAERNYHVPKVLSHVSNLELMCILVLIHTC